MHIRFAVTVAALLCAAPATAAVKSSAATGFEIETAADIAAPPAAVYAAFGRIGDWWNGAHSYSGDARNLSLDLVAGGCLCERWAGGSAEHERVIQAQPGKLVRLKGGLGPLQGQGVEGAWSWEFAPAGTGTRLTMRYVVGGYIPGGIAQWAQPVDRVLAEAVARLKSYVEKK